MRALLLLPLLCAALAGCANKPARPAAAASASSTMSWRSLATPDDRKRLRDWRTAWVAALAKAKASNPNDVAAEGDLLEPDAAPLDDVTPPPGDYRCRVVKLGAQEAGMPDFVAYPAFTCRIGPGAGAAAAAAAPAARGGRRPRGRRRGRAMPARSTSSRRKGRSGRSAGSSRTRGGGWRSWAPS